MLVTNPHPETMVYPTLVDPRTGTTLELAPGESLELDPAPTPEPVADPPAQPEE